MIGSHQEENIFKNQKVSDGDTVCYYVRDTSSIKAIAKYQSEDSLQFQKVGDLNYFGIIDSLEFVKDKDNPIKYLKNFNGIANLGKPIPQVDIDFILEHMIQAPAKNSMIVEPEILLQKNFTIGSNYELIFNLENSLRTFVVMKLESVSKNWIKDRVPDLRAIEKWKQRQADHRKQNKWFDEQDHSLIEFSDFLDLLTLIISRKNWKECFEETFGHKAVFEGKMIELGNIRNNIAHNRELAKEEKDALDLYSRQIYRLIGKY